MKFEKFYTKSINIDIEKWIKDTNFYDPYSIRILQHTISMNIQSMLGALDPIIDFELLGKLNTLYKSCEIILERMKR